LDDAGFSTLTWELMGVDIAGGSAASLTGVTFPVLAFEVTADAPVFPEAAAAAAAAASCCFNWDVPEAEAAAEAVPLFFLSRGTHL